MINTNGENMQYDQIRTGSGIEQYKDHGDLRKEYPWSFLFRDIHLTQDIDHDHHANE